MANGCEREGTDAMVTRLRHEPCRSTEADMSHLGCQDRTGYFDEIIFSFTDHHCHLTFGGLKLILMMQLSF